MECCKHHHHSPSCQPTVIPSSASPSSSSSCPPPIFYPTLTQHSHLSIEKRAGIVTLAAINTPTRDICQLIATTRPTINHWIKHYRQCHNLADNERSGRPPLLSLDTQHSLVQHARNYPFSSTPRELRRLLPYSSTPRASRSTIRRVLDNNDLHGRVAQHEYPFNETHIKKRLSCANGYSSWTKEMWESVLLTDETKVPLPIQSQRRRWVQRPTGHALDPQYMKAKVAHPQQLNAWACWSARGPGIVEMFEGNLDSALLKKILQKHVVQQALSMWPSGQWYYLHDNDPKHSSSSLIREWLHNNGITSIEFPPYSPDLNPTENKWATWKQAIDKACPETIEVMKQAAVELWCDNSKEAQTERLKLVHSMPARLKAVIAAEGHRTKY
jgi:hypothetical protein